jgi:hypothetical protein
MQQQMTAAQQIEQINKQLNKALLAKTDAQATIEQADKEIAALRNVLAGVSVGMQLQREADAARAATENKPAE